MAYRERNLTGAAHVRLTRASLEAPIDGNPSVTFSEEEVLTFGSEKIVRPWSSFAADLAGRATEQFPLFNPTTGAALGTMARVRDLYIMLYSLHLYLAAKRDDGTLNPTPTQP